MACLKKSILVLVFLLCSFVATHSQSTGAPLVRMIVPVINSKKHTEFAPTISADGRTMIFESNREKDWKLYQSHLDDKGKWSEPIPLTSINEKLNFLAGPCLSYDGNTLYFTGFIENITTSEDIFYSTRLGDNSWSEPKSIGAPINTEKYEGFPSVSADGNSLYFIRVNEENPIDRKSKENCFKIYLSQKKRDGSWAEPEVLPSPINMECERDPKIMADNRTLLFSAIRPGGKGKLDLYQAKKLSIGKWTEPVPLEFINSAENDQSVCISASGDLMHFYSDEDIYSIVIPNEYRQMVNVMIQGYIHEKQTNTPIPITSIVVKNSSRGEIFTSNNQANDGRYVVVLNAGYQYVVEFLSDTHVKVIHEYDLRAQDKYTETKQDVELQTEYNAIVSVHDKDNNKPIKAWFQVLNESGKMVIKDSLKPDQYPFAVVLEAGKNYTFAASAPGYADQSKEWKYDPAISQSEMPSIFMMEHKKVAFTTDVVNMVTNQKIKTKIYFNNEDEDEVIVAEADETVYLRDGDRYQIVTSSDKGFMFTSTTLVAKNSSDIKEEGKNILSIKITPIVAGAHLTLDRISFDVNSSDMGPSSFPILERVIELLKKNPTISIQISAHTDDVGEDTYNVRLSERRALSIVRYLSKNGIGFERMRPAGYGKSKPLVANDSDESRAMNRRVELEVLRLN